jgi:hypothetical protein
MMRHPSKDTILLVLGRQNTYCRITSMNGSSVVYPWETLLRITNHTEVDKK